MAVSDVKVLHIIYILLSKNRILGALIDDIPEKYVMFDGET